MKNRASTDQYDAGVRAFQEVKKLSSNPHPFGTRDHSAWSLGWRSEQTIQELIKKHSDPIHWLDLNVNADWSHVEE